jgi:hypothetical protein
MLSLFYTLHKSLLSSQSVTGFSRCLVADYKGGRSPPSCFLKCPRPQLPTYNEQQQPTTNNQTVAVR